jgi:hypothetical protein
LEAGDGDSRTFPGPLSPGTLFIIDSWNSIIVKPRTTPPIQTGENSKEYHCLRTHIHIDRHMKHYQEHENVTPLQIKNAIRKYQKDPAVPDFIRKKTSLLLFFNNAFAKIPHQKEMVKAYLRDESPFVAKKTVVPPAELRAPGLYNSLKSEFILRFCVGNKDAITPTRDALLQIAANNISAEIKTWGPWLLRKQQSSEWAAHIANCVKRSCQKKDADGKEIYFDPFFTVTQDWFCKRALPTYLSTRAVCVLRDFPKAKFIPLENA